MAFAFESENFTQYKSLQKQHTYQYFRPRCYTLQADAFLCMQVVDVYVFFMRISNVVAKQSGRNNTHF